MTAYQPISRVLCRGVELTQTPQHIHLAFRSPRPALSSAVLNGGLVMADHFLNLRVDKEAAQELEDPVVTLKRYAEQHQLAGNTVAMMTAASMKSLRIEQGTVCGVDIAVLVTTGIENARRAGDPAEYRELGVSPRKVGTINTLVLVDAPMTAGAMVELTTLATEAKSALLQDLNIKSPVSGDIATGTGTDAIAIVGAAESEIDSQQAIQFSGKHTILGEQVARLIMSALNSSLNYKTDIEQGSANASN